MAAGVRPLVIDLDLRPGDVRDFEIVITPGAEEEIVDLTLYRPIQLRNGSLAYAIPEEGELTAADWVELDRTSVRVFPGEEQRIQGLVRIPFSAGGSYTVVIMVEPRIPQRQQGIAFQVRYAVRLNMRVDRPGLRPSAQLMDFELTAGEEQEPIFYALLNNNSQWDYLVSGEVVIRDEQRRLVERVVMRTPSGSSAGTDATRMYPGAEVEFYGPVTKRLEPGTYSLRGFFRYGDYGQVLISETITIEEGMFVFPGLDEAGLYTLDPEIVEINLRPGEQRSQIFQFLSETSEDVNIAMSFHDERSEYPYSLLEWVQLRSQPEFQLPGRGRARLAMTLAVPRDAEHGSYHGNLVLETTGSDGQVVGERTVPLTIVVGTEHNYSVDVRSLQAEIMEDGELMVAADIFNAGNIQMRPVGDFLLFDENDSFAGRVELTAPEGTERLIPDQRLNLLGSLPNIAAGTYRYELIIRHGDEVLVNLEDSLEL